MEHIPMDEVKPTSGSPLTITVNHPEYANSLVHKLLFQVLPGNLGDVYLGRENLNITTRVGIIARLRPPTANYLPDLVLQEVINISNPEKAAHFRVDVDNTGDGVIPTLGIA